MRIIARSLLVLVLLAVVACQTVPLTNRSQLLLIPEGLIYMARAGYHPQAARDLWVRMASQGGARQPEFLSTHPLTETRITQIEASLPEALQHYQPR